MVAGAEGCALVAMVARICAGSPKYAPVRADAERLISQADTLRSQMMEYKRLDELAYDAVVAARGDKEAMQRALQHAAEVPLRGAQASLDALRLAAAALDLRNSHLISDVGCAAEFAYAALMACDYNVRINHKFMKDAATVATQRAQLDRIEREGKALLSGIRKALGDQI